MAESKDALQQSPDRAVGTHRQASQRLPSNSSSIAEQVRSTDRRDGVKDAPTDIVRVHGGVMLATTVFHREIKTHEVQDPYPVGRGTRLRSGRQLHDQPPVG